MRAGVVPAMELKTVVWDALVRDALVLDKLVLDTVVRDALGVGAAAGESRWV